MLSDAEADESGEVGYDAFVQIMTAQLLPRDPNAASKHRASGAVNGQGPVLSFDTTVNEYRRCDIVASWYTCTRRKHCWDAWMLCLLCFEKVFPCSIFADLHTVHEHKWCSLGRRSLQLCMSETLRCWACYLRLPAQKASQACLLDCRGCKIHPNADIVPYVQLQRQRCSTQLHHRLMHQNALDLPGLSVQAQPS